VKDPLHLRGILKSASPPAARTPPQAAPPFDVDKNPKGQFAHEFQAGVQ
jgi:hypothetical protein